jgi:hypothetical protein
METTWKDGPPEKPGIYAIVTDEDGITYQGVFDGNRRFTASEGFFWTDPAVILRHCHLVVSDPPPLPKPAPPRPELFLVANSSLQEWCYAEHGDYFYSASGILRTVQKKHGWYRVEPQPKPPLPAELRGKYDELRECATPIEASDRGFMRYCQANFDCGDGK